MKSTCMLSLLVFATPLHGAPIDDAAALLQSRNFPEAAAAFAALPPGTGEPGYAAYLKALSLHLAGRQDEAVAAASEVAADSPWAMKARFLKGAALTKSKKHAQAEAIYAEAATRAFAPERRDALVKALLEFAEELVNPAAAGDANPPPPDWRKAATLCEKVLDLPITTGLREDVLFRKAMIYHKACDHPAAEGAFNAWLLSFDPEWSLPLGPAKKNTGAQATGKPRAEARLHLAENLLDLRRAGDARAVAAELSAMLKALPAESPDKALAGDAAWLHVRTFAPLPPVPEPKPQPRAQTGINAANQQEAVQPAQNDRDPFANVNEPMAQSETDPIASQVPQLDQTQIILNGLSARFSANRVPFPPCGPNPVYDAADYLTQLRAFLHDYPAHPSAPSAAEAIAQNPRTNRQGHRGHRCVE